MLISPEGKMSHFGASGMVSNDQQLKNVCTRLDTLLKFNAGMVFKE